MNDTILRIMAAMGSPEDHQQVFTFLRESGLDEDTARKAHRALSDGPANPRSEQIIQDFVRRQWGVRSAEQIALKACGECGEFAEAVTKLEEGRTTLLEVDEEVGDLLIVLSQWAAKRGTTLEVLREKAFTKIKARAAKKEEVL